MNKRTLLILAALLSIAATFLLIMIFCAIYWLCGGNINLEKIVPWLVIGGSSFAGCGIIVLMIDQFLEEIKAIVKK